MMKKTLSKLFIGLIAFCIGVFAVNYYLLSSKFYAAKSWVQVSSSNTQYEEVTYSVTANGKIGIYFNGFIQTNDGTEASFTIVNHSPKTVYYSSYSPDNTNQRIYTEPEFRTEGLNKMSPYHCAEGLEAFQLKSGKSVNIYVRGSYIEEFFEAKKENQVGFNFSFDKPGNYKTYWSENIYFATKLKSQISREEKKKQTKR